MEYPQCPQNYILDWKETSPLSFILHCRPLTMDESENKEYINGLIENMYCTILIAIAILCISCFFSRGNDKKKHTQYNELNV